jgi:hypothetical protein
VLRGAVATGGGDDTASSAGACGGARLLRLIDEFCWCSLAEGDVALFVRQTDLGARLFEFGVCAGLFDEV